MPYIPPPPSRRRRLTKAQQKHLRAILSGSVDEYNDRRTPIEEDEEPTEDYDPTGWRADP